MGKQHRSPHSDCCATHLGKTDNNRVQPRAQQDAPPRPTIGLDLRRSSPPRPTPGLGLNLGLGRNRILARPRPRPQEKSPPHPTMGSDQPRHRGYIITLPLASSGYEGTRPACSTPGVTRVLASKWHIYLLSHVVKTWRRRST
jgi:hypothetical protein